MINRTYLFGPKGEKDEEVSAILLDADWAIVQWIFELMNRWAEECQGIEIAQTNTALWRIFGFPIFIADRVLQARSDATYLALVEGASAVTLSIPVLHALHEPMETAYFMTWHFMARAATCDSHYQAIAVALESLAHHQDLRVRYAALHGIGHLPEDFRIPRLLQFTKAYPELSEDPWFQSCLDGTVL